MNKKLTNMLMVAGILSLMTIPQAHADDRIILNGNTDINGLSNITTTAGGQGGAVLNNGYVLNVIKDATFAGNSLTRDDAEALGGVIAQSGGTLNIADGVSFTNNTVTSGTSVYPSVTDGATGGAIYLASGVLNAVGTTTFSGNKVVSLSSGDSNGGAAYFINSAVNFNNVKFDQNTADKRGGAIYNESSILKIQGKGEFTGNSADRGGAIYNFQSGSASTVNTGTGSIFSDNKATGSQGSGDGGAIVNFDGTINVGENNEFSGNTAARNGGAIANSNFAGTATTNVSGGTNFTNNSAAGNGGAIYNSGNVNLDTTKGDITFSGNTAASGSDIYLDGTSSNLTITGNNKVYFKSDGSIAGDGNIANSSNVEFVNNQKVDGFTGKYVQTSGSTTLNNSSAFNNFDIQGGALNLTNGSIVSIDGNNVKFNGSDLSLQDSGTTLNVSTAIKDSVNIAIGENTTLNAQKGSDITLNTGDNWQGDIVNTDGTLTLDGFKHTADNTNGNYTQTGGMLNLNNKSELTVGEGSSVKDADININDSQMNVANGGTVSGGNIDVNNNSSFNVQNNGSVSGSNVSVNNNSSFNIENGGKVTDGEITVGSGSSFDIAQGGEMTGGKVNFTGNNKITIDGTVLAEAVFDVTNNNIVKVTENGSLTLNSDSTSGDKWDTGAVQLDGGSLTFNGTTNGTNGTFKGNSGNLNISTGGNQNFVLGNNSYINRGVKVELGTGEKLDISGGKAAIDNADNWSGTINLSKGTLDYSGTSNGVLNATGGSLNTTDGSSLTIGSGSSISDAVASNIKGTLTIQDKGVVSLNNGDSITGNININKDGTLNLGDNVSMAQSGQTITFDGTNSVLNLNGNDPDNKLDIKADITSNTAGSGQINKDGEGNVTFSGNTHDYSGDFTVNNSGNLTFTDADGFGGNFKFGNIEGKNIEIVSDKILGSTELDKNAQITYKTYTNKDLEFDNLVSSSNHGTIQAIANNGFNVLFNGAVNTSNGGEVNAAGKNVTFTQAVNTNQGTIGVRADGTAKFADLTAENNSLIGTTADNTIFNNLNLSNSDLFVYQNGFSAASTTIDGASSFNLMNGTITDNNIGTTTLNNDGQGNFTIDVSARDWSSDKFISEAVKGNGTLNVSDFQFINKCPIDRNVALKIFDYDPAMLQGNVSFTATDKEIFTPIGYYRLFSQGGGNYTASLTRYNPQVFRGQVATVATYQNQLIVNNILFDHIQEVNMQYLAQKDPNKYASAYPQFSPYQYSKKDGSLWFKSFATFEKLGMTQGLNVGNNFYGGMVGADFPAVELKHGWTLLPTAYIAYTGAHQTFANMSMYQNGGQGGAMATFLKNDFIGSVLAYGGGYGNDMDVAGYTDHAGNWFAGTAMKAAYNFHPTKHFIIQPTLLASYNAFGDQRWHTDFGDMSMRSRMLNGVNVAPGLNLIYGRETWSVYATVQYFYNILGYSNGRAGNVNLPGVEMRHGFLEYGIGFTKTWKDRFSGYLQVVLRNGGRTGVGFQGGLMYRL